MATSPYPKEAKANAAISPSIARECTGMKSVLRYINGARAAEEAKNSVKAPALELPSNGSEVPLLDAGNPRFESLVAAEQRLAHFNLLRFQHLYDFPKGLKSSNGVVIAGECGHLFIGEGSNRWISQLAAQYDPWSTGIHPWIELLTDRRQRAEKLGVKFVNLIVPEKQLVFHRFFGCEDFPHVWNDRPIARLIRGIPENLPILYPLAELQNLEWLAELYTRGNSHFSSTGCIVVAASAAKALNVSFDINALRFYRSCYQHDLMSHMMANAPIEEAIRVGSPGTIRPSGNMNDATTKSGNNYTIYNKSIANNQNLAIFGDSYSFDAGLSHALSTFFEKTHVFWTKDIDWNFIARERITHVLWESAERFIATVPSS